jgi:chemotaxis protein methyltransferase CheR
MSRLQLSDRQFVAVARLLHEAAGLTFDESRRDSLAFSIAERMNRLHASDVDAYVALLAEPAGSDELQALLDEVTIPETHFFRNPPQVRALRKYVLPELLRQAAATRRLRIWSAGCSTGEEAYTVAILLRELVPAQANWDIKVLGTDISRRALKAAEEGRYTERSFVMTEALDLARWFVMDTAKGGWQVRDEVRELVEFNHHNLVTDAPPFEPGEVDLILCRNVTIYFDRDTTRRLMQRLHGRLRDGGYLFLGHAETLWQISDDFSLVSLGDAFVYRRLDEKPGGDNRRVIVDRRTETELRPTRADRRRGEVDRRGGRPEQAAEPPAALQPPVNKPARPAQPVRAGSRDPLDAVRSALTAGRYEEAADIAAEVAAATPLWAEAHYLQGVALTNLGRDADALVVLRKTVYLDPDHGFAHFLLGGALERQGESIAASRSYRAAASTLGSRPMDSVAAELGGRSVAELAALCMQLARRADATMVRGRKSP